jgi:hypothetical protein
MLFLRSAALRPKPTPHQYAQDAAYSDDDRTRKLRSAVCKPRANYLKLKEIWTMILRAAVRVVSDRREGETAYPRLHP